MLNHAYTTEELHCEVMGAAIRGINFREAIVGLSPMIGAFRAEVSMFINLRGSLADHFRPRSIHQAVEVRVDHTVFHLDLGVIKVALIGKRSDTISETAPGTGL